MGCGLSQTNRHVNMRINILDSEFLRKENIKVRDKMDKLRISYETYISLEKMIGNMMLEYRNVVITNEQFLPELEKELNKVKLFPNIFVRTNNKKLSNNKQLINTFHVQYFHSYEELISSLSNRTLLDRQSVENNTKTENNNSHVTLKILRETSVSTEIELEMIKEALKSKRISFELYNSFIDLEKSLQTKTSNFIICEYQYHREVLNIVPDAYKTRIICVCAFTRKETYNPRVYFMTDNWLEIVNEIVIEQKWSHLNFVKCSKVFMYSSTNEKHLAQYRETIEAMGFDVRIYSNLGKIISESKYYFGISLIVNSESYDQVENDLQKNDLLFKTKLIVIGKEIENTMKSLHKVVKQLKRGYRGVKDVTRSVDVVGKVFTTSGKCEAICEEFANCNIRCLMYGNIDGYIEKLKYISPFVIVNEEESGLLLGYLKEVKASVKVVLYHRHMVEVKNEHAFCFVSDNFGKIVNFVQSNHVYNPVIPDPKRLEFQNEYDDFDKFDPSEIEQEDADLESYKITKYTTTTFNKSRK